MNIAHRALIAGLSLMLGAATVALAGESSPFANMGGLWSGQGRLGFMDGKIENVSCRTTYFVTEDGRELKQNIRCASGGAKIEVKSVVTYDAGKLTGTWHETVYEKAGEITGDVTPRGFRVDVKGDGVSATMDIIQRDTKQMVEIHFSDSTLLGLTLVLAKQGTGKADEVGSIAPPAAK